MTTIKLKNGSGAPTAGDLAQGEPALDLTNKRLYTEDSGGTVIEVGTNPGVDVTFADNRKAVFGADSDLQLYHSGSHSYIIDNGTGDLKIYGANIEIGNTSGVKNLFATSGGATALYYNNAAKLATSSSGIDVTGSVVSDGATVAGTLELDSNNFDHTAATPQYNMIESDVTGNNTQFLQTAGDLRIRTIDDSLANPVERFRLDNATGDISFYEDTGTTAKLFWDASAESLGIGTSSPDTQLTLYKASTNADVNYAKMRMDSWGGSTGKLKSIAWDDNGSPVAAIGAEYDGAKTNIHFHSQYNGGFKGTSDRTMSIMGNGNVGIGTSSPSATLEVDGVTNSTYLIVGGDDSSNGRALTFTSSASAAFNGAVHTINAPSTQGAIALATGSTERMRIDSSGNLLVGKTDTTLGTAGIENRADGRITSTRSGNTNLVLNRLSSDGSLIDFYKDGITCGQINARSGDLVIGTGTTGLQFYDVGNAIFPLSASGNTNRDAAIDLGEASNRFKDLYLSGGVYLGGTGSANHLDDYEEGTFTGAVSDASSGGNESSSVVNGTYVKVGAVVYVQFNVSNIITTGMTAGNDVFITGLPFVTKSVSGTAKYTGTANLSVVTFEQTPFMQVNEGQAYVKILEVRSGAGNDAVVVSQLSSGASDIHGNLVYETA